MAENETKIFILSHIVNCLPDYPESPGNLALNALDGNITMSWSRPLNLPRAWIPKVNVTYFVTINNTKTNTTYLSIRTKGSSYTFSEEGIEVCKTFNFYVTASNDVGNSNPAVVTETIPICK